MFKITELFQLIYTDFDDSYSLMWEDHKYYISFLDNYFRAIYVYLLKTKNEAFFKFKKYKTAIELQSNKKIKFIYSDDEGEYKNLKFNKILKELST